MAKKFEKFGTNKFGIVNSDGKSVSHDYIRRYIHCWCRVSDGFTLNRKSNIEFFMTDEFLSAHPGKTASQIGQIASKSDRWGVVVAPAAKPILTEDEIFEAEMADAVI